MKSYKWTLGSLSLLVVGLACSLKFEPHLRNPASDLNFPVAEEPSGGSCQERVLKMLDRYDPHGRLVYETLQKYNPSQMNWFNSTIASCNHAGALIDEAPTCVHEGNHGITAGLRDLHDFKTFDFMMIDGTILSISRNAKMTYADIDSDIQDRSSSFYKTYFTDGQAGIRKYGDLLDEFNAYTHGLVTATKLGGRDNHDRDGVASFMNFAQVYIRRAKKSFPETYAILKDAEHVKLLRAMWTSAEAALAEACMNPRLGSNDAPILERIYLDPNNLDAVREVLEAQGEKFEFKKVLGCAGHG